MSARSGPGTMPPVSTVSPLVPPRCPGRRFAGAVCFPVPLVRLMRRVALFPFAPDTQEERHVRP